MNENEMPIETAIGQLEALKQLIAYDGYGDQYVKALQVAITAISKTVSS